MVPGPGGDEETFEDFTARSVDHLTRLGYLLSGDHERLVRECLAEVRRSWPRADATRVLVARFLASPGAEPGRQPDPDVDVDADLAGDLAADPGPGDDRHEREALWWALGALPPRQRAAVVLRYWAGLSVAEVAAVLGCPDRVVAVETGQGLAGVVAAAAELTAVGGRAVGERVAEAVLADGLGVLAEAAPPLGVSVEEIAAALGPTWRGRRRWLSVALAVVVLVAAGVVAMTLRTGPTGEADGVGQVVVSEPGTTTSDPVRRPPFVDLGSAVVDAQARKLTRQLAVVQGQVLPGAAVMHPAARPPDGGDTPGPLEFHTYDGDPQPGRYLAQATVDVGGVATALALEVRRARRGEAPGYAPCPEIELDCTFRQYPDRTRADVIVYTDPSTRMVVHSLSSLRPDGTLFHVTVHALDPGTPPPLGVEDLFRFSQVFTY